MKGSLAEGVAPHGPILPAVTPPRYELAEGRILTWSLEVHLVDHCNLRCAHCCTLSPLLPARVVDPAGLQADLERAARVLRPHLFKLTGGEPLLHPDLPACLQAARRSGISERVSLTSNGFLLPRAADAVYAGLDRITVSLYPSAPLPAGALQRIEARCREHGVQLALKAVSGFREMDAFHGSAARARAVHAACWLRVRCHLLHEGRFYACTRPPHLAEVLARQGRSEPLRERDGLDLSGDDLRDRLRGYLEAEEPLESCRHCLGASGALQAHRQVPVRPRGAAASPAV